MEEEEIIEEEEVKPHIKLKKIIIIIILLIATLFIYTRYIATYGFIVKEYGVINDKLPSNFNGIKIAHLSDIHYGSVGKEKLESIVKEVNIMKPDIIVFTGDLYDEYFNLNDEAKTSIIEVLSKLEAPLGKYAIDGNHDYDFEGYDELIKQSGFTYLKNESKLIYYNGDEPIEIVGYSSYLKGEPNYNIETSANYKIALIHEGDALDNIVNKNYNLVLAGHSHGGQVRIPFIGALTSVEGAKKYSEEHYPINNGDLYISFGLGQTKYMYRAFNKPSFNFYRLYSN